MPCLVCPWSKKKIVINEKLITNSFSGVLSLHPQLYVMMSILSLHQNWIYDFLNATAQLWFFHSLQPLDFYCIEMCNYVFCHYLCLYFSQCLKFTKAIIKPGTGQTNLLFYIYFDNLNLHNSKNNEKRRNFGQIIKM